jgi:hypothetical protein
MPESLFYMFMQLAPKMFVMKRVNELEKKSIDRFYIIDEEFKFVVKD